MVLSEVFAPAGGGPYRPARVDVSFGNDVSVITLAGEVDLAMAEILTDVCNATAQSGSTPADSRSSTPAGSAS
jgi:hypothetical protein